MDDSTISTRLRCMRKSFGYKQAELGKIAGVSQGRISQIERDPSADVHADVAFRLAQALKISPYWLIYGPPHAQHSTFPTAEVAELISLIEALTPEQRQSLLANLRMLVKPGDAPARPRSRGRRA